MIPRRVIKLGGSLLDVQDLPLRLLRWLATRPDGSNWIVVGGGRRVDRIRAEQAAKGMTDQEAHWQAVSAMTANAQQLRLSIPSWPLFRRLDERIAGPSIALLDLVPFMQADARSDNPLPQDWTVTSDSIAARFAQRNAADELVLLKSVDLPVPQPVSDWSPLGDAGLVDEAFPAVCPPSLPVRWVNLRSETRAP